VNDGTLVRNVTSPPRVLGSHGGPKNGATDLLRLALQRKYLGQLSSAYRLFRDGVAVVDQALPTTPVYKALTEVRGNALLDVSRELRAAAAMLDDPKLWNPEEVRAQLEGLPCHST